VKAFLKSGLLISLVTAGATAFGQPAKNPADKPAPVHASVFTIPASAHDGRDPFFPESTRPYATAVTAHVATVPTLTIKGFSGTPGNRLIIINNHTFGVGDEGEVLAPGGQHVHVRCLAINSNTVVIEADNQRRELRFSTQ
jgi:hypothetical protein